MKEFYLYIKNREMNKNQVLQSAAKSFPFQKRVNWTRSRQNNIQLYMGQCLVFPIISYDKYCFRQ